MPAPQRATIETEVHRDLCRWITNATSYMDATSLEFKIFERSIKQLSNADPYAASLARGMLFHFVGDIDESLHWINNARLLSTKDNQEAAGYEALVLSNLCHFSRSFDTLVSGGWHGRVTVANMLYLVAGWDQLVTWAREMPKDGMPELHQAAEQAAGCIMTLDNLNISQGQVRRVLDLAGTVAQKRRLFFVGELPLVYALGDCLLYQLEVDVEPSVAAEMTNEVVDLMVESELDLPGLAFAFIGTKTQEQRPHARRVR